MIQPTVGRVVWFYPSGAKPTDQPLAAMIVCVWSDTCVNLAVFDKSGNPMVNPPTSVLLIQEGNPVPSGGFYCTWMPYQKGQAQKTEALEKQLAEKP